MVEGIKDLLGSDSPESLGPIVDQLESDVYSDKFDERGCPRKDANERFEKRKQQLAKDHQQCKDALGL